ncbi:hypothetical protein [Streptomyces sp. CO7]
MTTNCRICARTCESGTCDLCRNRIRGLLHQLPLQWTALQDSRQRLQGGGGDGRGSARLHAPTPGREDVLNLLGPASPKAVPTTEDQTGPVPFLDVLWSWTQAVTDGRRLKPVPRRFEDMLGRLLANLGWICASPMAVDFEQEIRDLVRVCEGITLTTSTRTEPIQGLTCPSCEMLSMVRVWPSTWAAQCRFCEVVRLDERDLTALMHEQTTAAKAG